MKRILFIILLITPFISFGQVSFSCEYREYCYWDEVSKKFKDCEGYSESSLFVMSKNETMFTHTIESMKSTYYVKEKKRGDDGYFEYEVVSDVGNEYYYMFDFKNEEVKCVYKDKDGDTVLIRFYVKSIF